MTMLRQKEVLSSSIRFSLALLAAMIRHPLNSGNILHEIVRLNEIGPPFSSKWSFIHSTI